MIHARFHPPTSLVLALSLAAGIGHFVVRAQSPRSPGPSASGPRLAPTTHPPLPGTSGEFLFVPGAPAGAPVTALELPADRLARGIRAIADKQYQVGLPLVSDRALLATPLAAYSRYYTAVALRGLGRLDEADATLIAASAGAPIGFLDEAVPRLRAEIAMAKQDPTTAVAVLESISPSRALDPEVVLSRLGAAAEAAGDREKAIRAYRRVYFEYPLSAEAEAAGAMLVRLQGSRVPSAEFVPLELERAEALFAARRWADARDAFELLRRLVSRQEDRDLAGLRVAECDYYLNRHRQAREALAPYLESSARRIEARFFALSITRALGDHAAYVLQARRFVQEFPTSAWTEETLNGLATHFIVTNDDATADEVFRELLTRFPLSRYSERAAWKAGWTSYRAGRFAEAAQIFDQAAANAPRADFRPSWLYWSARAYDQVQNTATANQRYRLTATDYLNSYYGRLASRRLADRREPPVVQSVGADSEGMPAPQIPSSVLVRELVRLGLYDDALHELEYADRAWGGSAAIVATTAWIRHHRANELVAMERFQNLRGAINQMKRAYPQYLAAGGEALPAEVLKVIFPLDYWPLIKSHSDARGLDPYLMVALVAQESTFTADIRSSANAFGLMQLIPSTARRYAAKTGVRYSAAILARPETNVLLGMTYFKELMDRFGGAHFALASYNAGESRVAKWMAERPGVPQDEFIDDIPFPETQNYVKRILGTAEDYRRLYGGGLLVPGLTHVAGPAVAAASSTPVRTVKPSRTVKPAAVKAPATKRPAPRTPARTTRSTRAR
ncbi:MAG: transglycosylase SLT domain-containing protein [Vicinamibacterales bacterium]